MAGDTSKSPVGLREMIKAGALSQLCNYFHNIGGRDSDWPRVEVFAMREFRNIEPHVIRELIGACKLSVSAANIQMGLSDGERLRSCDIP